MMMMRRWARLCDIDHIEARGVPEDAPRSTGGTGVQGVARMGERRLDTLLAERGLFASRSRAAASVMAGEVRLGTGERRAAKPGEMVDVEELVTLEARPEFVSRGGIKLANALSACSLEVAGRRALDVGASTGGF